VKEGVWRHWNDRVLTINGTIGGGSEMYVDVRVLLWRKARDEWKEMHEKPITKL